MDQCNIEQYKNLNSCPFSSPDHLNEFECSGNVINIDKRTMGSSSISKRRMKLKGLQGKTI